MRFKKLKLIWAIIKGRTVIYKANIDMKKNAIYFKMERGWMVDSNITFRSIVGGGIIECRDVNNVVLR